MVNVVKRFGLFLLCVMYFSLVSCNINEHIDPKEIKKNAVEMMTCIVDKDDNKLFSYFNSDMKSKYSEQTLKEIDQLLNYFDGNIISYNYKGIGGEEENKHDGHIYYYICYPEFEFTTDAKKTYTIKFSYHYIWDEHPEYEGINMITIREGDDYNTKLSIGRNYYK